MLLYGHETWTQYALDTRRIKTFEIWTWRNTMKISWTEIKSNKEVLSLVQEPRQIITMIETRKVKFFGHVMRHNTFIINIMKGR